MTESTALPQPSASAVLVCGLGRLGQSCVVLLKELGIPVFGLHDNEPRDWETPRFDGVLDSLTIGDCRHHSTLRRAGVETCRAILLTTGDDRVNIGAALAARSLNPKIRLVIRSTQSNLNELLDKSLGNLMALDPSELPAAAFSLAALGDETMGLFSLDGEVLKVVRNLITPEHPWCKSQRLDELNTRRRRILGHSSEKKPQETAFRWKPDAPVEAGDVITTIEFNDHFALRRIEVSETGTEPRGAMAAVSKLGNAHHSVWRIWSESSRVKRAGIVVGGVLLALYFVGAVLYKVLYPEITLLDAINISTVLIFDGYSNMFAQLKLPFPIRPWLLAYSLLLTMSGTLVTGMLYALLTSKVLSTRFRLPGRHAKVPLANHTVVVGLDGLGRRVARLLKDLRRPVVGVSETILDPDVLAGIPVVFGNLREALRRANCARASSVVVLTEDDVANLELALMARGLNLDCQLVIRTDDPEFGRNVSALMSRAQALSVYALAAEAFAAAALGERVISLLRIGQETIVVTEYQIEAGDMLEGRLLSEVEFGYGVVPILHQREPKRPAEFFPSEDTRLQIGDRLVLLAQRDGLQNVEHGIEAERTCRVRVHRAHTVDSSFEGARLMSRVTGCELGIGRSVMEQLPATLGVPLYRSQAARLVRELERIRVDAEVVPIEREVGP